MKSHLMLATLLATIAAGSQVSAGERFCRWMGIGHGPGYHAYNDYPPTPILQTATPGWYPVVLPARQPAAVDTSWPGSIAANDWAQLGPPATPKTWPGP
jgi:hypothetical protein